MSNLPKFYIIEYLDPEKNDGTWVVAHVSDKPQKYQHCIREQLGATVEAAVQAALETEPD